jgi:uncharacterized protein with ParB-like and HNH nuclease domain
LKLPVILKLFNQQNSTGTQPALTKSMIHSLLDTRTTNFGDLISNGKIYRVPPFQRDYSWNEENWEDLWQDIESLLTEQTPIHYMGAIVLQSSLESDKYFTIIDGQQRLATLSILTTVVIDRLETLIANDIDPEPNRERQEILRRTYLGDKDPRSLRYSSKLILNNNNNDFYKSNLINLREPRNIRELTKSNQLLWKAFEYFRDRLNSLTDIIQFGDRLAEFLADTIARKLLFIQITVEDEFNAYTVFETLNARGIELTSTDLLKNYLFSLFQGPDDLESAQSQWNRIINTVRMEKFPEFLRYYLSLKYRRVRRERLFKRIKESVNNAEDAFNLLDSLESYSDLFLALGDPNDDFWSDRHETRIYIQELNLFRIKQAYPALFAAYFYFSKENFVKMLKLTTTIAFRYTVVGHLNPNELERIYNQVAIDIASEQIDRPREVFERLRSVYVSDEKFERDFSVLKIETKGQKKKLVRYILAKLENHVSGKPINEETPSIEHILPESPDPLWEREFTSEQIADMRYRLGNLTFLEPSFNREIGQKKYNIKRQKYQKSSYILTQQITNDDWTPDSIARRQQELAKQAVRVWRSDFV